MLKTSEKVTIEFPGKGLWIAFNIDLKEADSEDGQTDRGRCFLWW